MFVQNQRLFLHAYIKSVATNKNTKQETHKQSCNKKLTPCALYPAATGTPGSPEEEVKGPEVHERQLIPGQCDRQHQRLWHQETWPEQGPGLQPDLLHTSRNRTEPDWTGLNQTRIRPGPCGLSLTGCLSVKLYNPEKRSDPEETTNS